MQEAYCPPCSEYSFCCPNWVPPILTWPGGYPARGPPCRGVPYLGVPYPTPRPDLGGYPAGVEGGGLGWGLVGVGEGEGCWWGYPLAGYPQSWPGRVPPQLDLAGYPPGVCPMEFWVMLQSIIGYGYPPGVCPMAFWVMLQSIMGYGYPP